MIASWQRELRLRRAERRARMMIRVVNRTFKKQPTRIDGLARKLVEKATS